MNHWQGRFRALGNVGDVLSRMGRLEEASVAQTERLREARQGGDRSAEAEALGALGTCNRRAGHLDKALGFHSQVIHTKMMILIAMLQPVRVKLTPHDLRPVLAIY